MRTKAWALFYFEGIKKKKGAKKETDKGVQGNRKQTRRDWHPESQVLTVFQERGMP